MLWIGINAKAAPGPVSDSEFSLSAVSAALIRDNLPGLGILVQVGWKLSVLDNKDR